MQYEGHLKKMTVQLGDAAANEPVQYTLMLGESTINMNELIGQTIRFNYEGRINCRSCGKVTKKSFAQGFCYPCFQNSPMSSPCIIRPELCEGHLGRGRDVEWEEKHHVQKHIVYLAIASGIKVGVTRHDQVPIRWIDQGAWKAIRLAETPNRFNAGQVEVSLKNHISDKTHWQKMLKNVLATDIDIHAKKAEMQALLPEELQAFNSTNEEVIEILYPVIEFPTKVKSMGFDKLPEISGKLMGIKGQYLIFDEGRVMNIRKHTSYWVSLEV